MIATAPDVATPSPLISHGPRLEVLDGWRATSILLVLAGHWLPLGPRASGMNEAVAATGMALFFTLSGFLIVRVLLIDDRAVPFLIRRFFRIAPLAWATMLLLALAVPANMPDLLANLAFVANLPPDHLMWGGHHLWSLCVEVQFYLSIAAVVALLGRRGLLLVPVGALAVTIARIAAVQPISIVTWHRLDEILAGGTLALLVHHHLLDRVRRLPVLVSPLLLALTVFSTTPWGGVLAYARPYLAAGAVGTSLIAIPRIMQLLWCSRPARYVAEISYAVYVVHGVLTESWLGQGSVMAKYAKRPLLTLATWALAHARAQTQSAA